MSEESWRFRTARGVVTVRADAIGIRSTPGHFLAGQVSRWRNGDRRVRGTLAFRLGGFLFSVAGLVYHFRQAGESGVGLTSASYVFALALFAVLLWSNHVGETTIPLSTVETVTLDEDEGTLTIVHEPDRDFRSVFRDDEVETTLSLTTTDDVREAREIFRLRGIDLDDPGTAETETTYRVLVRDGACFCERCRSQVSPTDGTCPACGYAIRVRTSGEHTNDDRVAETGSGVSERPSRLRQRE